MSATLKSAELLQTYLLSLTNKLVRHLGMAFRKVVSAVNSDTACPSLSSLSM
jgi:hypothetical protein